MREELEIIEVTGRQLIDSQGMPAIEAEVVLENGAHGRAIVPIREEDDIFFRKYDLAAGHWAEYLEQVLAEAVLFEDASDQYHIDHLLKDTGDARSCQLALSMAASRAAGAGQGIPLYQYLGGIVGSEFPLPMMTMFHRNEREGHGIDAAEIMIVPSSKGGFSENLRVGTEIYHMLKRLLKLTGHSTAIEVDGSFSGDGMHMEEAMEFILDAGKLSGYGAGRDFTLALNMEAEHLYDRENCLYLFDGEGHMNGRHIERDIKEMIGYYLRLLDGFPISVLEGIMADEDENGWKQTTKVIGHRVLVLGSSMFHTDKKCLEKGMKAQLAGGLVVKLSEAGTVSAAMEVNQLAKQGGYKTVVSHMGRETEDSFLSDFAVAVKADYIKAGAPCRGERTEKYNELLRLEHFFSGRVGDFCKKPPTPRKKGCNSRENMVE